MYEDYYRSPRRGGGGGGLSLPPLTRAAKILIGVNVGIWLLCVLSTYVAPALVEGVYRLFALRSDAVLDGYVYQVATYQVLHALNNPLHVLGNMLLVYFFSSALERRWGTQRLLWFALLCGVGGGVMTLLFDIVGGWLLGSGVNPVVGFSAAGMGMLTAFCLLEAEAQILLFFVLPIRAKYMLWLALGIDLLFWIVPGSSLAFPAHLGGCAMGALLVTGLWRPSRLRERLRRWRRRRQEKESNVVSGPWLN